MTAAAVNITVTSPTADGYLTVWNNRGDVLPNTSTLNFRRGQTVTNMAIVPVAPCVYGGCAEDNIGLPTFGIANQSPGTVDIIVDVINVYNDGRLEGYVFTPVDPVRIVDTRTGFGMARLSENTAGTVDPSATLGAPYLLVANATAVRPTATTYLTLYAGPSRPPTSTVNARPGQIVSNHAYVDTNADGSFEVYNRLGATDVLIDVVGAFNRQPGS